MRCATRFRAVLTSGLVGTASVAMLAASGLGAPAQAQSTQSLAAHRSTLPLSAAQLQADQRRNEPSGSLGSGTRTSGTRTSGTLSSLAGQVRSDSGSPLSGVCVTAFGPGGQASAVTNPSGRYLITKLQAGRYQLRYHSCAGAKSPLLPEWYGDVLQRNESRAVVVDNSSLAPFQTLAPVTLYPADSNLGDLPRAVVAQHGSDETADDPFGKLAMAPSGSSALISSLVPRFHVKSGSAVTARGHGRISGVVTSASGAALKGICVAAVSPTSGAQTIATTSASGSYRTASLAAGTYDLFLYPGCGNTGNWLFQIYKGIYNPNKNPTPVKVAAGGITSHIDAVMRDGGEISGIVTGPKGRKLSGICASPLTSAASGQLVSTAVSKDGVYHIRSVPPGAYQIGFAPCGESDYAPTLWPGTQSYSAARKVHVSGTRKVGNIDQVLQLGGIITGVVTGGTTPPAALPGICVFVAENNGLGDSGDAATGVSGGYVIKGLAPGSYSVQFQPGCDNNANFVGVTYPQNVAVSGGVTTSGIDATLPIGATISGTVTSARTGGPVPGICVDIEGTQTGTEASVTTAGDGTYSADQLPVDTYQVVFSGGCGNTGSYAPQGYDDTSPADPQNIDVSAAGQSVTGIDAALAAGPAIRGTVTSTSGRKLSGICVFASTPSGSWENGTQTARGTYDLPNLAPGSYQVSFSTGCGNNSDLADEAFRGNVNGTQSDLVSAPGGTISGINAVMEPGGGISGVVRTAAGARVSTSCVILTGISGSARSLSGELTLFGSQYQLTGLPAGGYQVVFAPSCAGSHLQTQWYRDKSGPAGATTVTVAPSRTSSGIDSALVPGGSIAGTLTAGGTPVHDMCVYAQNVTQPDVFGQGISNRSGHYYVHGLNSGQYELYLIPCGGSSGSLASEVAPQIVRVRAPEQTSGITTSVPAGATIAGRLLAGSPATGAGAAGTCAEAFQVDGGGYGVSSAAADGTYSITNLAPGDYRVYLGDQSCSYGNPGLAPQWYLGKQTAAGATTVTVSMGTTTTIADATLAADGSVIGTVRAGGGSLRGVCVAAFGVGAVAAEIGAAPDYAVTTGSGGYRISYLPAGKYRVQFSSGCGAAGYRAQWWKDKPTRAGATLVTVTSGTTTAGISATLRS